MPANVKTKKTAQRTRKRSHGRAHRPIPGHQERAIYPRHKTIVADSIHSLILEPKPGADVWFSLNGDGVECADDMYRDLLACLKNALQLTGKREKGERFFDPLNTGLSMGMSIDYVTRTFKNEIVPFGFDFNIDYDSDTGWYFSIYKELDSANEWCTISIRRVVDKLQAENKPLHDLFVSFLATFAAKINIPTWFDTIGEIIMDHLPEKIEELHEYDDHEQIFELTQTIDLYKKGMPSQYGNIFKTRKYRRSTGAILKKLPTVAGSHKELAEVIREGCRLISLPYTLDDFEYGDSDNSGLRFMDQYLILWDESDNFSFEIGEYINAYAMEGVFPPIVRVPVTGTAKELDLKWLVNADTFPVELNNFFLQMNECFKKYEPNNRRSRRHVQS